MAAKRLRAKTWSAKDAPRLPGQSSHRGARADSPSPGHFVSDVTHRAPSDARDGAKQMPRLRVSVKYSRHFSDSSRQLGRGPGQRLGDLGKSPLCHRSDRLGDYRKKLAGGHPNQREEMLGRLIFALGFRRQFTQVFHHGVWIDFADGADLVLVFVLVLGFGFAFVLVFTFAEQAAGDIADGAEPALAFQASLIFHLIFQFVFGLVLEFRFELVFEFRQGFQFAFICHDQILLRNVIELSERCMASAERCGGVAAPQNGCAGGADACRRG
jgi:hypothetical protein